MIAFLRAYLRYDPAAKSLLEILLFYPGVKAIAIHRLAHFFYQWNIPLVPRAISEFGRWLTGIEIHPGAQIGAHFVIDHGMGVVIGETAIVGNGVIIYQGVTLGGTALLAGKRHPTIGDRVVIGAGAKILGNITVGTGSRIGANAVVLSNVAPDATVVGFAGRVLQKHEADSLYYDFNI